MAGGHVLGPIRAAANTMRMRAIGAVHAEDRTVAAGTAIPKDIRKLPRGAGKDAHRAANRSRETGTMMRTKTIGGAAAVAATAVGLEIPRDIPKRPSKVGKHAHLHAAHIGAIEITTTRATIGAVRGVAVTADGSATRKAIPRHPNGVGKAEVRAAATTKATTKAIVVRAGVGMGDGTAIREGTRKRPAAGGRIETDRLPVGDNRFNEDRSVGRAVSRRPKPRWFRL